jgi:hypothetical protein
MKNLDCYGQDIYFFDDTYKKNKRLNIVAHGALQENGSGVIHRSSGNDMTADELYFIIRQRKNLFHYDNIRTIICHSADGKELSFAQRLANLTNKPIKAYNGEVTANFDVIDVNKMMYIAATLNGDDGMEFLGNKFSNKYIFKVYKTNPYPFFSAIHWRWNYSPACFHPK